MSSSAINSTEKRKPKQCIPSAVFSCFRQNRERSPTIQSLDSHFLPLTLRQQMQIRRAESATIIYNHPDWARPGSQML